ncbi:MAG TPA: tetratricopeptide repeat protein [Pirellulales bacterium]|nr:tetratricopeptide repeat protein [Pirellulales bacterium]
MRFIVVSLVGTGILCLCAAAGSGERPDDVETSDDEVFISDMPAKQVPTATRAVNRDPQFDRESTPLRPATAHLALSEPPSQVGAVKFEAFEFDGIQPGVSTIADVRQLWGEPLQSRQDSEMTVHQYAREPFAAVELAVAGDSVHSIVVRLRERFAEHEVAEQLQLHQIEPAPIFNRAGICREKAYPERGVTLRSPAENSAVDEDPEAFQVAEIEFGEIHSQLFLLRAQARLGRDEGGALNDLDSVLALEPGLAAWEMKVKTLAAAGRLEDASQTLDAALARSPNHPELRLLRVGLLSARGDYQEAISETRVLAAQSARPVLFRAKVLVQWGRLLAEGPAADFKQPIDYYQQAMKLVEPLLDDPQINVRRAACETLVEAHLAMAYSIAWGRWKMKETAVSKWLEQAEAYAGAAIENGDLNPDYSLRIGQLALAAHVGAQGAMDPTAWADQTLETGRVLVAQARDPVCRRRLQWQLGLACHDALQVYEMRQQFDSALRYGKLAVAYLEQGRPGRQETAGESFMLGRLYYRLGTLHAQRLGEHDEAVAWYERALPLLDRQTIADAEPGRHGEELVTAAISYWNIRQRDKALAMTARGIKLLERAVEQGDVEKGVLSVPYANLAAMHEQLGDRVQAASYSEQAASAKTETVGRP